jgi:hypothetical protein
VKDAAVFERKPSELIRIFSAAIERDCRWGCARAI